MHGIAAILRPSLLLVACVLVLPVCGCGKKAGNNDARKNGSGKAISLSDKPLAAFQAELLDVAFETATSIPADPHIKDRSKAQEAVVATCLELEQPKRALGYIERMDNQWQRNLGYANLAFHCADHNDSDVAGQYLDLAAQLPADINGWRKDRVWVRIAQTYTLLQQAGKADQFGGNLANSETGKLETLQATVADAASFDAQTAHLDSLIAKGNFDIIRNALQAYAGLFDRVYEDTEKRSAIEQKIRTALEKHRLPIFINLELLIDLSSFSLAHNDKVKGLELVNEAQQILDGHNWPAEQHTRYVARVCEIRFRAGDIQKARSDANSGLVSFNERKDSVLNIHRADALRPLAEAYRSMGDTAGALSIYRQVVEEGNANPNSRPRAEDLSATCCSMARAAVEPDAALWTRIRQIKEGLGEPW